MQHIIFILSLSTHPDTTPTGTAQVYTHTTYRHKLECDEAGRLTRSNCARYGNWPL